MTTKITRTVIQGFAALALAGSGAASYAGCTVVDGLPQGCNGNTPTTPTTPTAPSTSDADAAAKAAAAALAAAKAEAAAKADAAAKAAAAAEQAQKQQQQAAAAAIAKQQAELTAQQKQQAELTAQQKLQAELKAQTGDQKLVGGDQTMTGAPINIDTSDKSVHKTTISTPVSVAPVAGSFLVPPQVMAQCGLFDAKDTGGWGFGIQYKDQSYGFHYKGKTTSILKTDMDCLTAVHNHAGRMQNLQFQHEIALQASRAGVELDKIVYAAGGPEGRMVVLQKNYAPQIAEIVKDDSDARKLFNMFAPKPAQQLVPSVTPTPVKPRAAVVKGAAAPKGSTLKIDATGAAADEMAKRLAKCEGTCPMPVAAPAARAASAPAAGR